MSFFAASRCGNWPFVRTVRRIVLLTTPALGEGAVILSPDADLEGLQRCHRHIGVLGLIDGVERGGILLVLLTGPLGHGVADQVHETGLYHRLRIGSIDGFR